MKRSESLQESLDGFDAAPDPNPAVESMRASIAHDAKLRCRSFLSVGLGVAAALTGFVWASNLPDQPAPAGWVDACLAFLVLGGGATVMATCVYMWRMRRRFAEARRVVRMYPPLVGRKPHRFYYRTVAFFGLGALCALAGSVYMFGHAIEMSRYGTRVTGEVVGRTCTYKPNNYSADVWYEFKGTEYTARRVAWAWCPAVGESASLIVNSRRPEDVSQSVGGFNLEYLYGLALLGLAGAAVYQINATRPPADEQMQESSVTS